jgi:hypothetical protein
MTNYPCTIFLTEGETSTFSSSCNYKLVGSLAITLPNLPRLGEKISIGNTRVSHSEILSVNNIYNPISSIPATKNTTQNWGIVPDGCYYYHIVVLVDAFS